MKTALICHFILDNKIHGNITITGIPTVDGLDQIKDAILDGYKQNVDKESTFERKHVIFCNMFPIAVMRGLIQV